jgi:hypothetical protein
MIERVCPVCTTGNPVDAEQCSACQAVLDQPLVHQPAQRALTRRIPTLPARWERAGKAVALGAVALAVEVGAAWLQQRSAAKPAPLARQTNPNPVVETTSPRSFVARQRIWETYEQDGRVSRRVVEHTYWRVDE